MTSYPVFLDPKGVSPDAMRAFAGIIEDGGVDLDDRLRAALPALKRFGGWTETAALGHLLGDLFRSGWSVCVERGQIGVTPPVNLRFPTREERRSGHPSEPFEVVKRRRREVNARPREKQLADPAVRRFLSKMETPRLHAGRSMSVLDLVDDGHSLAAALADAERLPPSEQRARLEAVVRPEIEVAAANGRCRFTGLPLLDVWRYFRHTWSMEYRPTPGRSTALLIRNAARPNSPLIGIASLANATMQLTKRDKWIGWHIKAVLKRFETHPESWAVFRKRALEVLKTAREEIRSDDLLARAKGAQGPALEATLRGLAAEASKRREKHLKRREERKSRGEEVKSLRHLPKGPDGQVDWRVASEEPLFVAKRAKTLADLLFAERVLSAVPARARDVYARTTVDADLRRAVSLAAKEVRKIGLASRLLELNICGAVPPYRDLLGGKLVAVAVASAEVSRALSERYGDQVSEIASQMAGRPITRDPSVCVMVTTSLYGKSSQYNRIRLDLGEYGVLRWHALKETSATGTAHLSKETTDALRALSVERESARLVNNLFGEGQSPRLRQVRGGISSLGLDPKELMQHGIPRMMYGLDLFEGARERLRLNEPRDRELAPLSVIAAAWRERWLSARIGRREILERVACQGPETVQAELAPPAGAQRGLFDSSPPPAPPSEPRLRVVVMTKKSRPDLLKGLYRALGSCAEHHDPETVDELHIKTSLDAFIRDSAPGRVVFLTGNPGDGKTHLLRRLDADLRAGRVEVILDANERSEAEIVAAVDKALRSRRRGLAVAINEGILHQLVREAGDRPWAAEVERQLLRPLCYREEEPESGRVLVVDLSMRNNLAPEVVQGALEQLIKLSAPCSGCPGPKACPLQRRAARIVEAPASRLAALLDRCAEGGTHATMRDVQGLLSRLLWGESSCEEVERGVSDASEYWDNAFDGSGPLFDALRRLDPCRQTRPLLDHELWRAEDRPESWLVSGADLESRSGSSLDERMEWFISRKRRALFEHRGGEELLQGADPTDDALREILKGTSSAVRRLVRMINHFYGASAGSSELLWLWCTHRYDARPSRYAAASVAVQARTLELLLPRPRPEVAAAFPDYKPDHGLLIPRGEADLSRGLRVDRPLVEALQAAEHGLSPAFRLGEPEARISAFLDKLSKSAPLERDEVDVIVVDRDLGDEARYTVEIDERRYDIGR